MSTNDAQIRVNGVGHEPTVIRPQDTSLWWNVKPFVKRTHDMIEFLTKEGGGVASWMGEGNFFVIKNQRKLPRYFRRFGFQKMQKYKSFEKQLNDYHFQKLPLSSIRPELADEISFCSNAVFFAHPKFRCDKPAEMVSIVDRRSIKASSNHKNITATSEEAVKLRIKVAHLESCLDEIESKFDLVVNKMLEESDSLRRQLYKLSNFKSTRNVSYERVLPNAPPPSLDYCFSHLGINTDNVVFASEDFDEFLERELLDLEHTLSEQKFATVNIEPANISRSLSPFAMSTDNPDSQDEIEPISYTPINH